VNVHRGLLAIGVAAVVRGELALDSVGLDDRIAPVPRAVLWAGVSSWPQVEDKGMDRNYEGENMQTDQAVPKTIDEYIAGFPLDVQEILEKIRATIRKAAPDTQEAIKYQMPTFTLKGNLVHFAAFKRHIGFYPVPTGIKEFKDELSVYEGGKGSVQFPLDQPIPYDLIGRIVEFRVKENLERAEAKGKKKWITSAEA
jgi:uncharacterized protein YdhG (YjbR/CyaY superfamily)